MAIELNESLSSDTPHYSKLKFLRGAKINIQD